MKLPIDVPVATGHPFIGLGQEVAAAILRTVEVGWLLALKFPDVSANTQETMITERLRDGMRHALNSNKLAWKGRMVILPGTESRSGPEVVVPDGRTDIPIFSIEIFLKFGVHDPHAIIECKRIAGNDARLCREYVVEGIDRYRLGKYGSNHLFGFMVGYLTTGDAHAAATGINRYLDRKARNPENLERTSQVRTASIWRSNHMRSTGTPIELHHAFLTFMSS